MRAVVVPTVWDAAAGFILREIGAFRPDLVIMNGVAGPRQALWLERGAGNLAKRRPDVTGVLLPATERLVVGGPHAIACRADWPALREAALATAKGHGASEHRGETGVVTRFDAVLQGVVTKPFPRRDNAFLCNATTYQVGCAIAHPSTPLLLFEGGGVDSIDASLGIDCTQMPWLFVHWPSDLRGAHLDAAVAVLRALVAAQLQSQLSEGAGRSTVAG